MVTAHVPKVGRVGVVADGRPVVLPVNYAIVDGAVVFRTGRGAKPTAARDGAPVAFEVDEIERRGRKGGVWRSTVTPSSWKTTT